MKKLLAIVVLGFLLVSCVQNISDFNKKSWQTRIAIIDSRDVQTNLFDNDKFNIYLGTNADWDEKWQNYGYEINPSNPNNNPLKVVAKEQCKRIFNSDNPKKIEVYEPTRKVIKEKKFYYKRYTKYKCENPQPRSVKKDNKSSSLAVSNNTLSRTFNCSYSGGTSKIKIRGATAAETTSAGVLITYSNVNLSDKGAFSLSGSSKDTRAWFIGAASFLLLDIQTIPARCD